MATRALTATKSAAGVKTASWTGLLQTDVGEAVTMEDVGQRKATAQAVGTFGAGGSINIQGSNDGTNWGTLGSIAASLALLALTGLPRFVRPAVAGGDGTTNIAVNLVW